MMESAELLFNQLALVFYREVKKNQCDEEDGCLTSGDINGMDSIEIRGVTVISTG